VGTVDRLERIYRYEQSCEFLPHRLKSLALSLPDKQKERVEELRLRVMHPLTVLTLEGELNAAPDGRASLVTVEDLEQMLGAVTEYSRYACIETLRQGFLPLRGGVDGTAAAAHDQTVIGTGSGLLVVQRHRGAGRRLGGLPHIALGVALLVDAVPQLFIAGAVVGRAALRADNNIVLCGKGLAASRTGYTGIFHRDSLLIGTLPCIII